MSGSSSAAAARLRRRLLIAQPALDQGLAAQGQHPHGRSSGGERDAGRLALKADGRAEPADVERGIGDSGGHAVGHVRRAHGGQSAQRLQEVGPTGLLGPGDEQRLADQMGERRLGRRILCQRRCVEPRQVALQGPLVLRADEVHEATQPEHTGGKGRIALAFGSVVDGLEDRQHLRVVVRLEARRCHFGRGTQGERAPAAAKCRLGERELLLRFLELEALGKRQPSRQREKGRSELFEGAFLSPLLQHLQPRHRRRQEPAAERLGATARHAARQRKICLSRLPTPLPHGDRPLRQQLRLDQLPGFVTEPRQQVPHGRRIAPATGSEELRADPLPVLSRVVAWQRLEPAPPLLVPLVTDCGPEIPAPGQPRLEGLPQLLQRSGLIESRRGELRRDAQRALGRIQCEHEVMRAQTEVRRPQMGCREIAQQRRLVRASPPRPLEKTDGPADIGSEETQDGSVGQMFGRGTAFRVKLALEGAHDRHLGACAGAEGCRREAHEPPGAEIDGTDRRQPAPRAAAGSVAAGWAVAGDRQGQRHSQCRGCEVAGRHSQGQACGRGVSQPAAYRIPGSESRRYHQE